MKVGSVALAFLSGVAGDQCCFGGCGQSCQGGWCGESEAHCTGNCKGTWCPDGPGPSPPSPGPSPPGPAGGDVYCPTQESFGVDGNVQFHDNGWTLTGGGGVHSKVTWNLNGGYVEFDMDTSRAGAAVNTNLYTTSPNQVSGTNECDIQGQNKPSCMEMDIIEMNGNCLAQTTVHTWPNKNGGCDRNGCASAMKVSGKFHVKAEFSSDGWMTVHLNDQKNENYQPSPSAACKANVVENMKNHGAQIQSSQWVGWVPGGDQCPSGGSVDGSSFTITNLRVKGSIVQGAEPKKCTQLQLSNSTIVV